MYAAYQSGQSGSALPMRFSCSPCAASARRRAAARSPVELKRGQVGVDPAGEAVVTSWKSQPLPSGSLNVANEP